MLAMIYGYLTPDARHPQFHTALDPRHIERVNIRRATRLLPDRTVEGTTLVPAPVLQRLPKAKGAPLVQTRQAVLHGPTNYAAWKIHNKSESILLQVDFLDHGCLGSKRMVAATFLVLLVVEEVRNNTDPSLLES